MKNAKHLKKHSIFIYQSYENKLGSDYLIAPYIFLNLLAIYFSHEKAWEICAFDKFLADVHLPNIYRREIAAITRWRRRRFENLDAEKNTFYNIFSTTITWSWNLDIDSIPNFHMSKIFSKRMDGTDWRVIDGHHVSIHDKPKWGCMTFT